MTSFYASSVKKNVIIPNDKVCGYKISNEYDDKGFSSGFRAGKKNGVVNQKLNRPATDCETECVVDLMRQCPGNTNWNNHKGAEFMKIKEGNIFSLDRPAFRSGTVTLNIKAQQIPKSIRAGVGNYEITRNNFLSPAIRPRDAIDFDKLQAIDIETQGTKIQLSDKSISALLKTKVQIPDPQDYTWLAERDRMIAEFQARGMNMQQIEIELNTNKPLGREQRKINADYYTGQNYLPISSKLVELEQEIREGRAESRQQQAIIISQLALALSDINSIRTLTEEQLRSMGVSLARLGIPSDHKQLGLEPMIVDINYYKDNVGLINLYLYSRVNPRNESIGHDYNKIVLNFTKNNEGLPGETLGTMLSQMSMKNDRRRFLNLRYGGMMDIIQTIEQIIAIGRIYIASNIGSMDGPYDIHTMSLIAGFNSPDVSISHEIQLEIFQYFNNFRSRQASSSPGNPPGDDDDDKGNDGNDGNDDDGNDDDGNDDNDEYKGKPSPQPDVISRRSGRSRIVKDIPVFKLTNKQKVPEISLITPQRSRAPSRSPSIMARDESMEREIQNALNAPQQLILKTKKPKFEIAKIQDPNTRPPMPKRKPPTIYQASSKKNIRENTELENLFDQLPKDLQKDLQKEIKKVNKEVTIRTRRD